MYKSLHVAYCCMSSWVFSELHIHLGNVWKSKDGLGVNSAKKQWHDEVTHRLHMVMWVSVWCARACTVYTAEHRAACSWQMGSSVRIRTVLCSESEGCRWGQRLSQDAVIYSLADSTHHVECELILSQIQAEATDMLFVAGILTTTTECYSLWQDKHWAGFHNRALVHTVSCRLMSGKQHREHSFLCMTQLFLPPNYLGWYSRKGNGLLFWFYLEIFFLNKT